MSGEDLDLEAMDQGTIYQRLQLAVDSLSLFCRICNTHSSCKDAAEAHESSNGHLEKVDSRAHRMAMIELGHSRLAYWCNFCGKDVHDVAAHTAGKGHCKAVKVESNAWSARLAVLLLCDELRRRGLAVPEWCPERLYLTQRGRNAARGCSAKATAAGVDDRGLDGSKFRAAAGAGTADRHVSASAGAAAADRRVDDDAGAADRQGDGLGALRSSVEMMMGNVRGRERFEGEMLMTLNTLSEGMQSMARQRSDFETHVVGSLDTLSQELEALRAILARRDGLRLQATVVLAEVDREQNQSG